MQTTKDDTIRQAVRESYAKVARGEKRTSRTQPDSFCCGASDTSADTAAATVPSCCGTGASLEHISQSIGYSKEDLTGTPEGSNMGLGCGNPVALGSLEPGETVVDLGSGGGFDCFLAAQKVGPSGRVIGVDMTPEMISKARDNAEKAMADNVEFRLGEIEHLPVADNSADIIMSNCVVNLSPDKLRVYREAHRVLKPGGRLAIADILATAPLPDTIKNNLALVAACVGGAATIADTEKMLRQAGFSKITITPNTISRELIEEWAPDLSPDAADYVVSADIVAIK